MLINDHQLVDDGANAFGAAHRTLHGGLQAFAGKRALQGDHARLHAHVDIASDHRGVPVQLGKDFVPEFKIGVHSKPFEKEVVRTGPFFFFFVALSSQDAAIEPEVQMQPLGFLGRFLGHAPAGWTARLRGRPLGREGDALRDEHAVFDCVADHGHTAAPSAVEELGESLARDRKWHGGGS